MFIIHDLIHFGARAQAGAGTCPFALCHARMEAWITWAIRLSA